MHKLLRCKVNNQTEPNISVKCSEYSVNYNVKPSKKNLAHLFNGSKFPFLFLDITLCLLTSIYLLLKAKTENYL